MTYKQSAELGGQVRKGETGSMVVYASRFTRTETDASGEEVERGIPFLKAYTVFCADQIDDLPAQYYGNPAPVTDPVERIAHADAFFANTGAVIRHGGNQAFFAPLLDIVQMPPFESFQDAAGYYATLGHEMTHWVGSDKRLDRNLSRYNKDRSFRAREELVADLGGCFLAADLGIVPELEPRPDHASYLANWLTIVKNDRRFIFAAACPCSARRHLSARPSARRRADRGGGVIWPAGGPASRRSPVAPLIPCGGTRSADWTDRHLRWAGTLGGEGGRLLLGRGGVEPR